MAETLQHLVLVRHGQSEGDVRRAAWGAGEPYSTYKTPDQEGLTLLGLEQSGWAGEWIRQHVLGAYALDHFDAYSVSPAIRCLQTAGGLNLTKHWDVDAALNERHRGRIRGLTSAQHREQYPDSYAQMHNDPLHWLPPGGEAIVPDVASRVLGYLGSVGGKHSVIAVTHRDFMWTAMGPLEHFHAKGPAQIDTDAITNAHIFHYTSLNPANGDDAGQLGWVRRVSAGRPDAPSGLWLPLA